VGCALRKTRLCSIAVGVECRHDESAKRWLDSFANRNKEIKQLLLEHSKKSVSIDFVFELFLRKIMRFFKQEKERQELRLETLNRIKHKVGIRLMRYAQPEIIGICLAMSSLELPPYVLLWIIDWLPNYDRLSHHKKIHLIESVRASIWKIKGNSVVVVVVVRSRCAGAE
jgi:hypothetical protein